MLTGEPDAGNLHVRFGGRGGATQCAVPTPIIKKSKGRVLDGEIAEIAGIENTRTAARIPFSTQTIAPIIPVRSSLIPFLAQECIFEQLRSPIFKPKQ